MPEPGTVLITGASRGIGRATALRLAARGYDVLAGVRDEAAGAALRDEAGGSLTPILLDVTDDAAIAAAAATVGDRPLAGLVNNAGIAVPGPLEYLPSEELRRQFEVNVVGQLAVTRALMPAIRRGGGRIVNVGSIGGRIAGPFTGAYSASKFALRALTDSLRIELAPWGIPVVLIEPTSIATPIWASGIAAGDALRRRLPPEGEERYGRALEARRAGAERSDRHGAPPETVAEVIEHALTAPKPRRRYLVGPHARAAALLASLPDRLRDRLVVRRSTA
jgi:NAD(P)-dependent dehydrogenase (short-subunit alcohol dehydrogenase family)